jgi:squalene-hopene/tetraprenyl-beta-curcumene cyclase
VIPLEIDKDRLAAACEKATQTLLDVRCPEGHWEGRLSSSALSTATALGALAFVGHQSSSPDPRIKDLVEGSLRWLADNVNEDGGWGDTDLSFSNISTTTLCWAAFGMAGADERFPEVVKGAEAWLTKAAGGIEPDKLAPAIVRRYGKDKTFSVPILTMCVISGRMGQGREAWKWVKQLPFELAAFPHTFFAALRLPVVSYALPALIAIGQARHARRPTWNPLTRVFRNVVRDKTLEKLKSIQPESGGFLEAAPLTSFVAMSLAAAGQGGHPVTAKCVEFLAETVREDGSWPIDTNLATWVTTLAINALGNDLEFKFDEGEFGPVRDWILDQQYTEVHPYTNAAPGGWAWTDLSGGVPDADDTAGAILALETLRGPDPLLVYKATQRPDADIQTVTRRYCDTIETTENRECRLRLRSGARWLLNLQNGDGGVPTFCKGWTNLPFDRSSPDITAHALRAWEAVEFDCSMPDFKSMNRFERARKKGIAYLTRAQQADGSWIPLWFGNQHNVNEENRTYGSAKVLMSAANSVWGLMRESRLEEIPLLPPDAPDAEDSNGMLAASFRKYQAGIRRAAGKKLEVRIRQVEPAVRWFLETQRDCGGWGGGRSGPPSVEETALSVEALAGYLELDQPCWNGVSARELSKAVSDGIQWLIRRVENGEWTHPSPIGFYFAKLWYYEELYPIIFTVAALNRVKALLGRLELEAAEGDSED